MTGGDAQVAESKGGRGAGAHGPACGYAIFRLVLDLVVATRFVFRPSVGERGAMLLGRYSGPYAVYLALAVSFAVWHGLLFRGRRLRAGAWQPILATGGLWVLMNLGLAHFGDSFGLFSQLLVLCQIALLTAEGAFAVFVLGRRRRRHRVVVVATRVCFALLAMLLLSTGVDVAVRCGGPRIRSLGGLCDTLRYRFNSLGLRGGEIGARKPDGELRVIVLGDSITFGQAVAEEHTFAAVLERLLAADGLACRVVNAGERGTNARDQAGKMEALLTLAPDLIVQTYVLNDAEQEPYRPVTLLPLVERHLLGWSTCLSAVRAVVTRALVGMRLREGQSQRLARLYGGPSWRAAQEAMGSTVAAAHARGVPVLLGVMPVLTDFGRYPFTDIHRDVAAVAGAAGYDTVVDLLPVFLETAVPARRFHALPFDSHPGPAAHRLVAEAYHPLCRKYLVGQNESGTEDTNNP